MPLSNLPKPVLFHPLKHHLGYIQRFIHEGISAPATTLKTDILAIGNASQLDVYTGKLSAQQIAEEAIACLQQRDLLAPERYRRYLAAEGNAYRIITLSDGTDWVLRWGVVAGRHVHLHPARYAVHTIRVKANVLKTAMAALIFAAIQHEEVDLKLVNAVRATWLSLPLVKKFDEEGSLAELLKLLPR
ncbi:hypothetical protein I2I11_18555 [Pontibacter sp. 172403-2]|uniref:hypothetical protein n=1 Tax=Pontibacter rufus TaxID=2791028 RepID=UPI0018AF7800|nr:hypothetical protein [Pontibacter sp. 172403-2]MBF9255306.1 hypothetical protein [Pontibacter sp. 172403-2]